MQALVEAAPKLMDYLGEESLAHFNGLRALLDAQGIALAHQPAPGARLDYYNLSVFEFTTALGSQGTVCAGGRYDGLIAQVGGKPAPAVGWRPASSVSSSCSGAGAAAGGAGARLSSGIVPQREALLQVMLVLRALARRASPGADARGRR